ncbi:MAG: hypothetical protein FH758_12510 [Firmicutes bacterium]|nr:hypothetical protein [Bacillota bacterium]
MNINQKISNLQLFFLLVNTVSATAVVFLQGIVAETAGRDSWLTPVIATIPGIYIIFIIFALSNKYPNDTIYQYSEKIVGRLLGKFIALSFVLFFLYLCSAVLTQFSVLWKDHYFPDTPAWVIDMVMVIITAYAVYKGVESIGRALEVMFPIMLTFFSVGVILVFEHANFEYIRPLLENGIKPVLLGSLPPSAWRCEVIILAVLYPFTNINKHTKSVSFIAIICIGIVLTVNSIILTSVFGAGTTNLIYPTTELFRRPDINVDSLFLTLWSAAVYFKLSILYFIVVLGIKQLFNLRDLKTVIIPIGILIITLKHLSFESVIETKAFLSSVFPPFALTIEVLIPTTLLIIAIARNYAAKK